ncbi:MAG TPA: hypothetical protein VN364_09410 [Bellilinea sp.]|nr:hypothetical protein [Bellilinea sp.]
MNNNRVVLSVVIFLAVGCACLAAVLAVSGGVYLLAGERLTNLFPSSTPTAAPPSPTARPATPTAVPAPLETTPTPANQSAAPLPAAVARQMDQIEDEVARARGLDQPPTVDRNLLTTDELRQQVESDFFKDYNAQEIEDDTRVLAALGLIEPGYDLYSLYLDLYTEQIAGYYDLETDEMFVVLDQDFKGPQRSTYAHEYTHALQEYNHNVRDGMDYTEEYCETDSEYCAALQALIEGDASLTEQSWLYLYGTDQDRQEIDDYYQNNDLSIFDSAPAFLQEDFIFPYLQGVDFALALFEKGGFAQIDQAYTDPPVSTEQILHPERYPDDKPVPVTLPDLTDTLGRELREIDRGVMGEWYTYLILARGADPTFQLADDLAAVAAEGWGGDAYAVYWDEAAGQPLVVLLTTWETSAEADEYSAAFQDYATARWGDPQPGAQTDQFTWESVVDGASLFQRTGTETIWVIAPSTEDAQLLLESLSLSEAVGAR